MYNRLDETDELLNLTVKNGDPKMVLYKDGRRWKPPGDIVWDDPNAYDPFSIRRRLLELMKQAIYQTRNKMVFMQLMKEKYDKKTLYKMGFLMSKTDTTCSIFASFAFKAYKKCSMSRQAAIFSYPIIDKLDATERLLNLWFDVDLLIDLIMANHKMCTLMLQNANATRKEAWKFID
ncbi:uncharacterized protein LOC112056822 [Bicyclus anynana]|uniref:Uncharacterized protein LOC112056822 n=1 Tax=Bicyclus anynana TaxID=110368 RepID=A0A6J1P5K1_BICAN|nr:uncharacterized protein LOC112056822 [Bicyclus anynana]